MRRIHRIVIFAFLLVACGSSSPPTTDQALATIGTGLNPATLPPAEPTLTAKEREDFATIAAHVQSMTKAATDLQTLSQEIRATTEWKTKVRTAAQIITGGQQTIAQIQLSDYYAPLAKRTTEAIDGCAKPAATLLALDISALTPASIEAQREPLQRWCVTELERIRLTVESL